MGYINTKSQTLFEASCFRISVKPEISILTKVMHQYVGGKTLLQCYVTAYPMATVFWEKSGRELQTVAGKHEVTVYDEGPNQIVLNLDIFELRESDFGLYTCKASNAISAADITDVMMLKSAC